MRPEITRDTPNGGPDSRSSSSVEGWRDDYEIGMKVVLGGREIASAGENA